MAEVSVTGPVSGTDKTLTFSTGVLAPQSQGAVVARIGDTQVLSTANGAKEVREGTDFFPLTIDVETLKQGLRILEEATASVLAAEGPSLTALAGGAA